MMRKMTERYKKCRPNCEYVLRNKEQWATEFSSIETELKELQRRMKKDFENRDSILFTNLYKKFKEKNEILSKAKIFKYEELNGKYEKDFKEIKLIGIGAFGIVFIVFDSSYKYKYAIKKIAVSAYRVNDVYNEVILMRRMNCEFIVKFIDSWIEKNNYFENENMNHIHSPALSSEHAIFDKNKTHLIHIQMELCFETFKKNVKEI
jgi:hypothetical protein